MLKRTAFPTPLVGPLPWETAREQPWGALIKFIAGLIVVLAIASIYLWQADTITHIRRDTARIEAERQAIERVNAGLMVQVMQWAAPSYIEQNAIGMQPAPPPRYVLTSPAVTAERAAYARAQTGQRALWRRLTDWISRRPNVAAVLAVW